MSENANGMSNSLNIGKDAENGSGGGDSSSPKLSAHPTLEEMERFFSQDRFATECTGCRIVEGWAGHGVCEMDITPNHMNAQGFVMGGSIFTLADFAFAVATMCGAETSVSLTSTIEFITAPHGGKLTAICDVDKAGHKVGFYTILVTDEEDRLIAKALFTCYRPLAKKQ